MLLGVALALTGAFMLVEFAGGIFARSLALMADAGHMLTDTAALALAWAATRIAARPADTRRSFGYQRLRVSATFVNGCALLFIVAWIAVEAVQRLMGPVPVDARAILWVGGLGLCVNLVVFAMLRRGDSHDMNIAAATLHVFGDLLGSAAAVLAGLVILLTGWLPIDPLLSLLVCVLIVRSAWALVGRSAHILMEGRRTGWTWASCATRSNSASRRFATFITCTPGWSGQRNAAHDARIGDRSSRSRGRAEGCESAARRALRHHSRDDPDRSRGMRRRGLPGGGASGRRLTLSG